MRTTGPMRHALSLLAALLALLLPLGARAESPRTRLVVIVVVDQLRADHLTRFQPWFLPARSEDGKPGGFRYLAEQGANHRQCRFDTLPTYTAVGHAIISTGGSPYAHGIIGNSWVDRASGKRVTSVQDEAHPFVGAGGPAKGGASPWRLDSSTVGDELKLSNNGQSRVFSVSLKDRAAILLGGRAADLAMWFDSASGRWVSSTWYRPDGTLPAWAEELNAQGWAAKQFGWTWTKALPEDAYGISNRDGHEGAAHYLGLGNAFPHRVTGGEEELSPAYFEAMATSPLGNTATFQVASEMVRRERLGRGPATDMLTINLASYDRVGHSFGPTSPEVQDMAVRTDRDLAQFFALLDREVGLQNTVIALTADHGCAPLPEVAKAYRLDSGRAYTDAVEESVQKALEAKYGAGRSYVLEFAEPHLYLNHETLPDLEEASDVARGAVLRTEGVFDAYTRSDIEEGDLPRTPVADAVSRSFHRVRSGDLFVVMRPYWVFGFARPEGTTHGAPWSFDTQVPLLIAGPGVKPGTRFGRCSPADLAPTLSAILGIAMPSTCSGRILEEDL